MTSIFWLYISQSLLQEKSPIPHDVVSPHRFSRTEIRSINKEESSAQTELEQDDDAQLELLHSEPQEEE